MTMEQKVEKLRGIANTNIQIWCEGVKEDNEIAELANLLIKDEDEEYDLNCDLIKTTYKVILEDGEIRIVYLNHNCDRGNCIPYSEFFADDKVEDKPLEDWTLKEVKEYYNNNCELLESCDECKINALCNNDISEWEFIPVEQPLTLTQSEIDILKAIKVIYPNARELLYNYDTDMFTEPHDDAYVNILRSRLPSLGLNTTYSIDELLGISK